MFWHLYKKEMDDMKIEILSMQQINNMGSLLQAYGLMKRLKGGHNSVHFLDIKKYDDDYALLENDQINFNKEYENDKKYYRYFRYPISMIYQKMKVKQQNKIFEKFRNNYFYRADEDKIYDLCVIGSDEVFNCQNAGFWGFSSQLFGNVANAKNVITYAACCGATTYETLPSKVKNRITDSLNKISNFSVRDQNTFEFVRKMSSKDIQINLDPVLISNFDAEINKAKEKYNKNNYCVVYSYKNRINSKNEINAIKRFCHENNLKLVAIGAPQFWIKDYVVCDPFECLKIIKNSSFVITDTFHGTIFSAKYANRFAVIVRDSNRNKLMDLVDRLSINEHFLNSINDISSVYSKQKDSVYLKKIIKEQETNTYTYLKNSGCY